MESFVFCAHCLLSVHWILLRRVWLCLLCIILSQIMSVLSLLQVKLSEVFQPLLIQQMLWSLNYLCIPLLDLL